MDNWPESPVSDKGGQEPVFESRPRNAWEDFWHNLPHTWARYRRWIRQPHVRIVSNVADEGLHRVLWWIPSSHGEGTHARWRQVMWGVLQLHRVVMDLALADDLTEELESTRNRYGTTIAIRRRDLVEGVAPTPPRGLGAARLCLTMMPIVGPIAHEISGPRTQPSIERWVERVRFMLKAFLLAHYWRDMSRQNDVSPGLIQHGGRFVPVGAASVTEEEAHQRRVAYVGRRTGRRVRSRPVQNDSWEDRARPWVGSDVVNSVSSALSFVSETGDGAIDRRRILLGELLYMLRPLLWAQSQSRTGRSSFGALLLSLGIDITSLAALNDAYQRGNPATRYEWERRRMRLLLYLLRSPMWDRHTRPAVEGVERTVDRSIPWLGNMMVAYLQDWLYYWKLYGSAED